MGSEMCIRDSRYIVYTVHTYLRSKVFLMLCMEHDYETIELILGIEKERPRTETEARS